MDAEALQRDGLGEALSERRRGAGMGVRELAGERGEAFERDGVIGELPSGPQAPLDGRPVAFGEVIEDVAFSLMSRGVSRGAGSGLASWVAGR